MKAADFVPSKYQEAIFHHILEEPGNLVVEAVAGSGKTTTIIQALSLIPDRQSVLFCAFNKHIATELQARTPSNVKVSTLHSIGFSALRFCSNRNLIVDNDKVPKVFKSIVAEEAEDKGKSHFRYFYMYVGMLCRVISLLKAHGQSVPDRRVVNDMLDKFDMPSEAVDFDVLFDYVLRTWDKSMEDRCAIDFDDMIYLPTMRRVRFYRNDWIFIDEAQDLNPIQIEMVGQMAQPGTRVVAVGDRSQSVYRFRGAHDESMDAVKAKLNADELPLSICYRCPTKVVDEARRIVPHIECSDTAPEGEVHNIAADEAKFEDGAYVLCRINAPLTSVAMELIRSGRKATIIGRDFSKRLHGLVSKVAGDSDSMDMSLFLIELDKYAVREYLRLKNKSGMLMDLRDRVECIHNLSVDAKTVHDLHARIDEVFDANDDEGVIMSTVHRAKGREADNVYILRPDLMPHPCAKSKAARRQERNIKYVAITRAKEKLVWLR